jgi:hypothetical protein
MLRALAILILSLYSFIPDVFGQIVNIEQARIRTDTIGWTGHTDLNFQTIKYEEVLYNVGLKGSAQWKNEKKLWLLLGDVSYAASTNEVFNNSGLIHLRYNRKLNSKVKWEAFSQLQYNQLLALNYRLLNGTGFRFSIVNKESTRLYTGTLLMQELENIRGLYKNTSDFRLSNYVSMNLNKKQWAYSSTVYFQPRLDFWKDYRVSGQHTVSTSLGHHLRLKFELSHFYDSNPPLNVPKSTVMTNVGLGIDL